MASQATWVGRPDEALTLVETGLVRADRLTCTQRAMLSSSRARALAPMRRARETLAAVGSADEHFAHATPADEPPFMAYYHATMHAELTGRALADLAMHGGVTPAGATERLTTAVTGYSTAYTRSRVLSQIKLASLTMVTGDPVEATALGTAALEAAGTIRSRRVADNLRDLARHATRHLKIDEVTTLCQRITTGY